MNPSRRHIRTFALAPVVLALASTAFASSHREAPFITTKPKVDATDFYMFRSYEAGRADYVTMIANYLPLQDAYGGPNYFMLDPDALYEIHVDNNGDAREDITFQFRFKNTLAAGGKGVSLNIGGKQVAIPLIQAGPVSGVADANLNVAETLHGRRGARRSPSTPARREGDERGRRRHLRQAGRQHRHQDHSRLRRLRGQARLHRQHPRLRHARQDVRRPAQGAFAVNLGTIFDLVNAPVAVDHRPVADRRGAEHHSTTRTSPRSRSRCTRAA